MAPSVLSIQVPARQMELSFQAWVHIICHGLLNAFGFWENKKQQMIFDPANGATS
jgi:hypothetical protein